MTFDPTPRRAQQTTFGHANGEYFDGEVTLLFANSERYGRHGGWAQARYGREPEKYGPTANVATAARISVAIDHGGSPSHRMALIIHEIGHVLGIGGDFWADIYRLYPRSIMTYAPGQPLRWNGRAYLYPIDRDSFRALYSVIEPWMTTEETYSALGNWMDSTIHVRGDIDIPGGNLSFGASGRNGFAEAYADGPEPDTVLADNDALSGRATWEGRLLGLDTASNTVGGAALLVVDLSALDGDLDFTDLESWTVGQSPGEIGTGTLWGDGDLRYRIAVRGNSLVRTGGDDGEITGAFVGDAHEGMGGTLKRSDLVAGFGGKR